jgi:hypothetical protein
MRLPSLILSLTLLVPLSAATTADGPPAAPAQMPLKASSPAAAPATGRSAAGAGREKARAPAAAFTPSEKLGAGSAVAFPVDI